MIASHNTFTCMKPRRWWHRLTAPLWRCQRLPVEEQIKAGVKYLDIRVRRDEKAGVWRLCHGLVDLGEPFRSLDAVFAKYVANGVKCRVILERGDTAMFDRLMSDVSYCAYHNVDAAYIKKGWKTIRGTKYLAEDYSYVPVWTGLNFWQNLKRFRISTPELWAKRENRAATPEMSADPKCVYYFDYATEYEGDQK